MMNLMSKISAAAIVAVVLAPSLASASADCPAAPKESWMTEDAMKAKAVELGFPKIKTFKVSGNCYEIYGWNAEGKKAEVYFNPVTGEIVKSEIE
jgi:hypothetical protein